MKILIDHPGGHADSRLGNQNPAIRHGQKRRQFFTDTLRQGCPPEKLDYYINANFPRDFTQAALLIAECLADYYRAGELTVTEYTGEDYTPVDHHITNFMVTKDDLQILLEELCRVQDPAHWMYNGWFRDSDRKKWLAHIRSVQQVLEEHRGDAA